MNQRQSLYKTFMIAVPFLAVFVFIIVFAFTFNTFSLTYSCTFYNILLALPVLGVFLILLRRFDLAVLFASVVVFLLLYIDSFVYAARLTHIRFSDFALISQAARVAGRYQLIWSAELTRRLIIAVSLCLLFIFIVRYYKLTYNKALPFSIGLALCAVGIICVFGGLLPVSTESFDFTAEAETNGLLYSWYSQYRGSTLRKPEGYSKEKAEAILSAYTEEQGDSDVNLIVIMNESLTDYSLLGETPFHDPLPNIHNYNKNFFCGKLAVSVFGGGTCNTEYEFLTGNSMAFLPEGSMPYLQYVVDDENSLAWDMGELGYSKTAIHPYYSEEWNRTQVYRFLGFDRFVSGADFGNAVVTNGMRATARPSQNLISFGDGPLYVRGLISDQSCFERVLEQAENEQSFVFAVTMQNHGGYEYDGKDFINTEYVTEENRIPEDQKVKMRHVYTLGLSNEIKENETYKVNQFLTCTNLSDAAFKMLTDALEQRNQKTIVLMFGDHQPSLLILEDYMQIDGLNETMYYDVPYTLWANFDIDFDAPEYTSPNYLSAILKKNAGLPLTAWDQFRLDMMEKYPVIAYDHILDKDYRIVDTSELNNYAIVQYMRMFDR